MGSFRVHFAVVVATAAALVGASPAWAEDPPAPPSTPSIDQYVETIPTSGGGAAPGVGKSRARPLSGSVSRALKAQGGPLTERLRAVATSSDYGAPQRDLRKRNSDRTTMSQSKSVNPLSAAVSAVGDGGDSHMFWLLAGLILVTTTMVWTAGRRQRA